MTHLPDNVNPAQSRAEQVSMFQERLKAKIESDCQPSLANLAQALPTQDEVVQFLLRVEDTLLAQGRAGNALPAPLSPQQTSEFFQLITKNMALDAFRQANSISTSILGEQLRDQVIDPPLNATEITTDIKYSTIKDDSLIEISAGINGGLFTHIKDLPTDETTYSHEVRKSEQFVGLSYRPPSDFGPGRAVLPEPTATPTDITVSNLNAQTPIQEEIHIILSQGGLNLSIIPEAWKENTTDSLVDQSLSPALGENKQPPLPAKKEELDIPTYDISIFSNVDASGNKTIQKLAIKRKYFGDKKRSHDATLSVSQDGTITTE